MDDYDCNNVNGISEQWDWEGGDYYHQKDPNLETSECLWNGVPQNKEDLSYMFDETTPVKACGDLAYHVNHDYTSKNAEECRETSSQVKRRRVLQFSNQALDPPLCCSEEMPSSFLKSNERVDSIEEAFSEVSHEISGCSVFSDNASAFCYESLDPSSEEWITDCFNDSEMHLSSETLNFPGASDIQIDISEFCDAPPSYEANNVVQKHVPRTPRNIVFKGRKSYIRTPTKLASSVAYPFAFIKPCGFHGDVTLKDINQRIRTPPPSVSKQNVEDPSVSFPTSAFSGKPVVGKTKIRTEGGKGSITIMRTKG